MKKEFSKAYSPKDVENKWYDKWIENGIFNAYENTNKQPYSILMPPPNVTGILHFGHVLNITLQDLFIRLKRMNGFEACWFPGTDHAGIATQSKVEAELRKEGLTRYDLGREKFVQRVWEWKEKYGGIILKQIRKLGASCDWNRTLFTMDESASNAVKEVFVRLFDDGLIYKGKRIINWSPLAQTALSDEEVEFREVKEYLYTLRYYFPDNKNYLKVATVRPETIFGDTAVAVNPNDERYKHLIGQKVRVPLTDRYVDIIPDEYADPTFGTGCVKITPAHDPNDFLVGERHNLEIINSINADGTLNEAAGEFAGLERFEARRKIVDKLKETDLIEKIEDYTHNVGFSQRGGEPIEPYLSDQWFVRMKPLAEIALKPVLDGEIKFHPNHWVKTYEHWMNNIRDWCISRQLWWGHRIPVYYAPDGRYTAARNEKEARQKLGIADDIPLVQDEDVLDTWFSSWLWPLTTMRWLVDGKDTNETMDKFLPTDLLVTAPDIIFFWVARMIMATMYFKNTIPFRNVYFTSTIRDGKGRKLSKSLGNSPDPLEIIDKYGADAVRFTMLYLAPLGQDVRLDVDVEHQDIPSCELGRNFANKIWNAGRFLMMKLEENDVKLDGEILNDDEMTISDRWILSRFHSTLEKSIDSLDNFKVTDYSKLLYDFIWRDFCDWYIEILKVNINNTDNVEIKQKLIRFAVYLYLDILKILHPVMPYITEEIHSIILNSEEISISTERYPQLVKGNIDDKIEQDFELVQMIVEEIRRLRSSINIPPSQKVPAKISIQNEELLSTFNDLSKVIANLAKISSLEIGKNFEKPQGAISSVVREIEVMLEVATSIDVEKEKERLRKEIERLEKNIKGIQSKLSNEKFVQNAPADIVQYEKEKLASMQESLAKTIENLKSLE
ncbi:MAG TPA: valine--tRNA ligase [Candidatus Kapabacteria bacterium]|nr:valine--tRNA ligase [Candidatus Kapabacteria bacterium]